MLYSFFIKRPVFTIVISILVSGFGAIALINMAIEQYPNISPPTVSIQTTYPGASAQVTQDSVTQVIEQQISGIDNLLYFSSTSTSTGSSTINLVFDQETNPDIAQMQVQNVVTQATSQLPSEVQEQGITVRKAQTDSLMVVAVYDRNDQETSVDISDYLVSNLQDPISRIDGVGETTVFGSQYAMRVWLDPYSLRSYNLTSEDVISAIEAQNTQVTLGSIGAQPSISTQGFTANISSTSLLNTPEQFAEIPIITLPNGSTVRVGDIARVEKGAEDYSSSTRLNGHPASGISIQLSPGANALDTSSRVKDLLNQLEHTLPEGYYFAYPRDSIPFIEVSINNVTKTLLEAVLLVSIVIYIFLQSWRATLIPLITIPVVLFGTIGVLYLLGMTLNTLTLFGLVLAIGLLVDDSIVVVENIERLMKKDKLSVRDATYASMKEITGALIGIAVVLSAVFLPMAWFGGSTGIIYKQFSITLVTAMALSAIFSIALAPSFSSIILKPSSDRKIPYPFMVFNNLVNKATKFYQKLVAKILKKWKTSIIVFLLVCVATGYFYTGLPTGFIPEEDQGSVMVQYTLPTGSTMQQTEKVANDIINYFMENEKENINVIFTASGRSNAGNSQNVGQAFAELVNWSERTDSAQDIISRANEHFSRYSFANIIVMAPAPVRGLGQSEGIEFWLQDTGAHGHSELQETRVNLEQEVVTSKNISNLRMNSLEDTASLHVDIDYLSAGAYNIDASHVANVMSTIWGGSYINDFIDNGRVKPVYIQADAPYRSTLDNLGDWYVRSNSGSMVSFDIFSDGYWSSAPQILQRFNGISGVQMQASVQSGKSSGDAMEEIQELVSSFDGHQLSWSGLSYQEQLSGNQALWLYLSSIVIIFMCLAALYESWAIPLSVMLILPVGAIGAILATYLFGLNNDIYFQIGLLATIGLSAKNAILIVEFVEHAIHKGSSVSRAVIQGARLRLRPIIMTSLAFSAGIIPLALSTGAGAASQNAIGISVLGGMISGTIMTLLFTPLFFSLIFKINKSKKTIV